MQGTGAERPKRFEMLGHTVALVFREAVAGMLGIEPTHQRVPRRLGKYRGGRNRQALRVAADDRLLSNVQVLHPPSVDQDVIGEHR